MRARILNSENEMAIRRVLMPAIRTAYARVPTTWITNVRKQMKSRLASMAYCIIFA
jgi:hypothetical protein